MSNYSDDPANCRVDFFKPSGKWYTTESVKFPSYTYTTHPAEAFNEALSLHLAGRMEGMTAVCLEPYVKDPFPVLTIVP